MKQTDSIKQIDKPNENKINDYSDCKNQMYSLKNEFTILRDFVKQEYTGTKRCYSEEEIQAVEKRLHFKLPAPIRTLYIMMGDLLINSYLLRPLELLCWDNNGLGFFASPESDVVIRICGSDAPNSLYYWSENDIEGESCVFEDDFDACNEVGDEDGKKKATCRKKQRISCKYSRHSPTIQNYLNRSSVDISWGSTCEWQILTWLSVLLMEVVAINGGRLDFEEYEQEVDFAEMEEMLNMLADAFIDLTDTQLPSNKASDVMNAQEQVYQTPEQYPALREEYRQYAILPEEYAAKLLGCL